MKIKFLLCTLILSASAALAQNFAPAEMPGAPPEPKKPASFDLAAIDKTVDPCVDFYKFACGNWIKNNPVPADQVRWGRFNELADRNTWLLYQELAAASTSPKTPLQKKYGDYYAACMNVDLANQLGAKPLQPVLDKIAAFNDKKKLAALVAELQSNYGLPVFFRFGSEQDNKDSSKQVAYTGQGGLSLPDRDYYLLQDDRFKKIREQYTAHVTRMFVLLGDTPEQAAAETASVLAIETALSQGSMARADLRDPDKTYHPMSIADLQALSPSFDWKDYLSAQGEGSLTSVDVGMPDFVKALNAQVDAESIGALRSYMRWQTIHGAAPYLSEPIVTESFNFFSGTLQGQKEQAPRWKRCTRMTDMALGEAVGQDWVALNFPPAAKENMDKLVTALEKSLGEDIKNLDWMSDTTKAEAEKKLAAFRRKIGYPDHWRDYSKLVVVRDDLVGNVQRNAHFEYRRRLDKIGKPVDEKEWGMTPPTVNAYYDPSNNDINFPAGILQPPFYDFKIDPAVNFGGIGVVIGHEMTHGFDDEGAKFGPTGNRSDWWTADDLKKFNERTDCEVKEYNGFEVAPGQNLNGKLTLGENTADNGGIRIAYQALMETLAEEHASTTATIDGFTPAQRYFIGFGQIWCSNSTEQSARVLARTDPHSSGEWRVKGVVQNFEQFGKAFGCKPGQPMMPVNSCHVW